MDAPLANKRTRRKTFGGGAALESCKNSAVGRPYSSTLRSVCQGCHFCALLPPEDAPLSRRRGAGGSGESCLAALRAAGAGGTLAPLSAAGHALPTVSRLAACGNGVAAAALTSAAISVILAARALGRQPDHGASLRATTNARP